MTAQPTQATGICFAALLSAVALSGSALAGECPADKVGVDLMKPSDSPAKGVGDSVIASIDLGPKSPALKGHKLRMRRLVIEPGGVVPWHSHGERPANIYIVEGSITEYRSTCAEPIEHRAGDVTAEFGAHLAHWWKNNGAAPVVIISADILDDSMPADPM